MSVYSRHTLTVQERADAAVAIDGLEASRLIVEGKIYRCHVCSGVSPESGESEAVYHPNHQVTYWTANRELEEIVATVRAPEEAHHA